MLSIVRVLPEIRPIFCLCASFRLVFSPVLSEHELPCRVKSETGFCSRFDDLRLALK